MGYTDSFLGRVTSLVATCTRHVSRATRRLLRHRRPRRDQVRKNHHPAIPTARTDVDGGGSNDDGLWRRTILMGERCQPLNFAGAIHYDSRGRRLPKPPSPPGSSASLPCRSHDDIPEARARGV